MYMAFIFNIISLLDARKHFWRSKSEIESPIKYTFYTISTYIAIFVLLGKTFKISYQTGI